MAVVLASVATSHAQVDVSGTWNFCLAPVSITAGGGARRPVGTLVQAGGDISGTLVYPFFGGGTLACTIGWEIDSATGVFVPGTATESCQFGEVVELQPAIATAGRIDGEYEGNVPFGGFARTPFWGLRACDPMASGQCDDGDAATTDSCSTTVDCFGVALAGSCVHTGCTTDADCADANPCTFARCDAPTGCAHPTVAEVGGTNQPPPTCGGGTCTIDDQCDILCPVAGQCMLAVCEPSSVATPVADIDVPRLTLGRLGGAPGDDTLNVKGRAILPTPLTIAPSSTGIRVRVLDANGLTVVDESVAGGAFDPLNGFGWKTSGSGVRYLDKRKVGLGQGPIRKVTVKPKLSTPGLVQFAIQGKAGSYVAAPTLPLRTFVDLDVDSDADDGAACVNFVGPDPVCEVASGGTKIRCR